MKLNIIVNGNTYEVEVDEADEAAGSGHSSSFPSIQSTVLAAPAMTASSDFDESKVCRSPLAGVVTRVEVRPGQHIEQNQLLLVLEAMKMEIKIPAPSAGTVKSIEAAPGDAVKPNQILVCFE